MLTQLQRRPTDTHINFATPTNLLSLDSSTAEGSSGRDDGSMHKDRDRELGLPRLEGRGVVTI